jgi:glucuronoarabinoxylan endo-1,4-beta-xylanase
MANRIEPFRLHFGKVGQGVRQRSARKFANKWLEIAGLVLAITVSPRVQAQTATVSWTNTHQTMDGFGGETLNNENSQSMTAAQAAMFYSTSSGIGMSYIRTRNTADGSVPDLISLQNAVAQGAKVLLTFQSPPTSLKASGNFNYGPATSNGTCFTTNQPLSSSYSAYASYMVNYINTLQSSPNNIPISIISIQNEPNVAGNSGSTSATYGDCIWTAQAMHDFIVILGPELAAAGLRPTIMLPELGEWFDQDLASTCLNDSACAQYVTYAAGHGYEWSGGNTTTDGYGFGSCCHIATAPPISVTTTGKHLWMTEINGSSSKTNGNPTYIGTIADALIWAHNIHDHFVTAGASAWFYWQLTALTTGGDNFGLTQPDFTPAPRYYVIGNWSKFVRPGWVRVEATANPQTGVYVTAFKDPANSSFVIVAVNTNESAIQQTFSLSTFPAVTEVIPWITSSSFDLAQQSAASVSGASLSYSLSGQSVTTFVGATSASNSDKAPVAPTGLAAVVR